ncbi:RloB family protein [Streptomyces sp. ActVer]|uniref:RloB family protein n=1 Tax=Streptomyces sp. ActVer TaxID=3014558 RepID=UPI0022B55FBB|nr:RloB family protein [Streptomyces sp. ActVer]MCZ4506732.1 RloB family protein [Streptomyces sp. ActVer]
MSNKQQARGTRRTRRRGADASPLALRRPVGSYGDKSQRVIYVATEGSKTEPAYLDLLNKTLGRGNEKKGIPAFYLDYCHPGNPNGLRPSQVVQQVRSKAGPGEEMWALFDRDAADSRDADIREAYKVARGNGVQVALSHPSFELWLLLHFKQWSSRENGIDTRVKDQLRRHPDAKGFQDYDKASGKRGKGLDGPRGQSLMAEQRLADAVHHARKLIDSCPHGDCSAKQADRASELKPANGKRPAATLSAEEYARRSGHAATCDPLKRDPSSDVWRLLAALGIGNRAKQ